MRRLLFGSVAVYACAGVMTLMADTALWVGIVSILVGLTWLLYLLGAALEWAVISFDSWCRNWAQNAVRATAEARHGTRPIPTSGQDWDKGGDDTPMGVKSMLGQ